MQVTVQIYKQEDDNALHFVSEGPCVIYEPEMKEVSDGVVKPYVSLNFGKYRLHIVREDFLRICRETLYNTHRSLEDASNLR
jgi:hypothetical protein